MNTAKLNLNPISSMLKVVWTIAFLLMIQTWVSSQVFTGSIVNTAGNSLIPSTGTGGCTVAPQTTGGTIFNDAVAGLGVGATLLSINVNFTHTFDSDIDMFLRAPNGQILELSTDNGAGNDNFTNTEFCDGAPINITAGAPPYTGQFRPEGTLVADVCGVTITPTVTTIAGFTAGQNGTWQLVILDDVGADAGAMISWSLNFAPVCGFVGAPGPLPALNFIGSNPAVCGIMNQNVTAPTLLAACAGTATMQVFLDGVLIFNSVMSGATFQISASLGMHTLSYRLPCVPEITQPLNVTDAVPPSIICPGDIVINLDPGACDAVVGYDVSITDNCPFLVQQTPLVFPQTLLPHGAGAITVAGNNLPGGFFFDLKNTSTTPVRITGYRVRFGSVAFGVVTSPQQVNTYISVGSTFVGQTGTAAAWQSTGNASVTVAGPNSELSQVNITGPYILNPGQTKGVYLMGINASLVYNAAAGYVAVISQAPFDLISGASSQALFGAIIANRTPNVEIQFQAVGTITGLQTSGLPSGSTFPIGTTTNCFTATDQAGNVASCCFDITINEFANPTHVLACNDLVEVSLDETCTAIVNADMVLEGGPYGCYDDYIVEIQIGGNWVPAVLGPQHIGQTIVTRVTDPETGNSCWGTISVEDKLPPTIECRDVTIMCGQPLPSEPAPEIVGYQNLLITGLNDLLEVNMYTYNFDFSYLPSTPALDVDCRIQIDDHTFLPDIRINVESPAGFNQNIFTITGCTGQEWPINCTFDDEGGVITLCADLNGDANLRLQPLQNPGVSTPVLFNLDGMDASGIWKVIISDIAALDDGHIREVGLSILVNLPQVDPTDNCGEVDLTFTDTESGDPCQGLIVTRHWVATDGSGNTAACDQLITVTPLVLDSVDCPADFIGHCGDSTDPDDTGWPSVNGIQVTSESHLCNIFVGYWDNELTDCGNGLKLVRTWTILDWCTHETIECVQVIKLADDEAPVLDCPGDITVGTDFWYCWASVSVPSPDAFDECGSAFTLSLTANAGFVVNFGNNYVINQLPLGTHTIVWTATDECGNSASCSFTITVVDDVVPVANCDEHTIVALTNDGPYGVTLVPAEVFNDGSYDNCGPVTFRVRRMDSCIDFDWTTEGACIDDIPGGNPPVNSRDRGTVSRPCVPFACCDVGAGPIMVELEVTDVAGNRNFCMVEAEVQDKISPFVVCPPDITVSCDFWFNVQEGTFTDSPLNHEGNGNGNLDEDPLSPVFGNMFDAFTYNDDESVRGDIIIDDPGNPQVNQPHFWGIDGWADDNCEVTLQVRVRVIDDCSGGDLPPGAPAGAVKLVERRFSALDGNEGIAPGTCTQRIWVVDFDPFFITDVTCGLHNSDDVVWPCDVLLTTCPDDIGDTGEPEVNDDACSLIGVTYEDQRFDFVDGACFKILREWSVIDWCQFDPLTGYGLWKYIQVIKVHDEEGPEFLNCPGEPVVLCVADDGVSLPDNNQAFLGEENPLASSCSVHLNLCQPVHEACSDFINYDVKLYLNNGDEFIYVKPLTTVPVDSNHNADLCFDTRQNSSFVIRNNGIPYNSAFCGDYHRLLWSAEDGCGNWSHCEYLIRLEDCKQPSPVCINGLSTVVMPIGGQVTIWAKDFNASSFDDCTPAADLLYSFSGDNYQPSFTYTCDNVPAFGVELSVNIWVADGGTDDNCNNQISWSERNKDYCTTTIVITDNVGACPDSSGSILAGEILTEDVQSVELVSVTLTSPGHVFPTYVTVEDGKYQFSNIILPEDYSINAERNDAYKNGVSTLDLVKIQKHLLGIDAITNPYDLIAADANNSQSVSAIDLIELRKLILGTLTVLPSNKSWRFVDKSFHFEDPTHPWPFDEVIDVANMNSSQFDKDFVAIKIGDVNNTVQANAQQVLPRNGKGVVNFVANDRMVNVGEMVDVAISSSDFAAIEGYQFTLQTQGLEFRGIESGIVNMTDENLGVFGSTITASWHKVGGVSASTSDVLFTLQFQATGAGKLSSMMTLNSKETQAEAYNTLDDIKDLKLTFRGAEHGAEFALYQNEPNPFKGNTMIGYDLPQAGKVTLTLFDVTGKVLMVKDQESVKGYNTISVSSKDLPSVGVLYYRLDANKYTAMKKMIIIE